MMGENNANVHWVLYTPLPNKQVPQGIPTPSKYRSQVNVAGSELNLLCNRSLSRARSSIVTGSAETDMCNRTSIQLTKHIQGLQRIYNRYFKSLFAS